MLIICDECKSEYSDKAPACPKCGCPNHLVSKSENATMSVPKSQTGRKLLFGLIGTPIVLILGFWFGLKFFSGEGGAALADQIVVQTLVPWSERAKSTLQSLLDTGENKQILANALLASVHPSGQDAVLSNVLYEAQGDDRLTVKFHVDWKGGMMGKRYKTVISWTIGKEGHVNAGVDNDTAIIGISSEDLDRLNGYLKDNFSKSLKANMDGAAN